MCDYSLQAIASRPAVVGETLISTRFLGTDTRGFASEISPEVAVCVQPGTELVFQNNVVWRGIFFNKRVESRLARFRHINPGRIYLHHDALEFANGTIVQLTDLAVGQKAVVLQLPVTTGGAGGKRLSGEQGGNSAPRDLMRMRVAFTYRSAPSGGVSMCPDGGG